MFDRSSFGILVFCDYSVIALSVSLVSRSCHQSITIGQRSLEEPLAGLSKIVDREGRVEVVCPWRRHVAWGVAPEPNLLLSISPPRGPDHVRWWCWRVPF